MTEPAAARLRDYSADSRILYMSALAAALGAVAAVAAWLLLLMIALATNLFYFHRWSIEEVDPWQAGVHWWTPWMPVVGGLIVGLIARYLSPKVRGHGMPEAVETIVFGGGRVQPRVAVLKPVATAIAIGSGGPFGAEGPVIVTGGAIGSVLGQLLPMSDSERKVLMVAGASAGMAATFNCPFAATLLAVEILLFEWKPRSLVPVAMACATAGAVRRLLLGADPLLHMAPSTVPPHHQQMIGAVIVGIVAAILATLLGRVLRFTEKMYHKLPIHWMWWPAIGGLFVGFIGMIFPRSLGVGYTTLQLMVTEGRHTEVKIVLGVLIVKSVIWLIALGSETAGGILAPLLLIGGAMGSGLGHLMPQMTAGSWVVVGMTSLLTASIGCPLTSAMLALELTRNSTLTIPVLLACMASYAVSVLVNRRSMLTSSLSQRGLHLSREFSVDPMESMLVSQAMHTSVFALPETAVNRDAAHWLASMKERGKDGWSHWQRIYPLVDAEGRLTGILTRGEMIVAAAGPPDEPLLNAGRTRPKTASPSHTLRYCALQMSESKLTSFPVVASDGKLLGVISVNDLLLGHSSEDLREKGRERVLHLRWPFSPARPASAAATVTVVKEEGRYAGSPATDASPAITLPPDVGSHP